MKKQFLISFLVLLFVFSKVTCMETDLESQRQNKNAEKLVCICSSGVTPDNENSVNCTTFLWERVETDEEYNNSVSFCIGTIGIITLFALFNQLYYFM